MQAEPVVPEAAIEERFLAGSGPGGQNVNKVATAVQLRADIRSMGLEPWVWRRLKALAGARMTASGILVITARRFRSQETNRADARERLADLLKRAHRRQARRVGTKPSKAAKARRLDEKRGRSAVKAGRARVRPD